MTFEAALVGIFYDFSVLIAAGKRVSMPQGLQAIAKFRSLHPNARSIPHQVAAVPEGGDRLAPRKRVFPKPLLLPKSAGKMTYLENKAKLHQKRQRRETKKVSKVKVVDKVMLSEESSGEESRKPEPDEIKNQAEENAQLPQLLGAGDANNQALEDAEMEEFGNDFDFLLPQNDPE